MCGFDEQECNDCGCRFQCKKFKFSNLMANTFATPEKEEKTVVAEKVVTQEEKEHEHKTCCSRQKKFVYAIAFTAFVAFAIAIYATILSMKCHKEYKLLLQEIRTHGNHQTRENCENWRDACTSAYKKKERQSSQGL